MNLIKIHGERKFSYARYIRVRIAIFPNLPKIHAYFDPIFGGRGVEEWAANFGPLAIAANTLTEPKDNTIVLFGAEMFSVVGTTDRKWQR